MKISLYDSRVIEKYLSGALTGDDLDNFNARRLTDPHLQLMVESQQETQEIVKYFGRANLKKEIRKVRQHMFTHPDKASFRSKINRIFRYGTR